MPNILLKNVDNITSQQVQQYLLRFIKQSKFLNKLKIILNFIKQIFLTLAILGIFLITWGFFKHILYFKFIGVFFLWLGTLVYITIKKYIQIRLENVSKLLEHQIVADFWNNTTFNTASLNFPALFWYIDKKVILYLNVFNNFTKQEFLNYVQKLLNTQELTNLFLHVGLQKQSFLNMVNKYLKNQNILDVLTLTFMYAFTTSVYYKALYINLSYVLLGLIYALNMEEEIRLLGLENKDFLMFAKLEDINFYIKERKKINSNYLSYFRHQGILDDWFTGFTFYIGQFTRDLTRQLQTDLKIYSIFHEKEIKQTIQTLLKPTKPYALLVGDPGVGKHHVVMGLTQLILESQAPEPLNSKRVLQIDVNKFLASIGKYSSPAMFLKYLEKELSQGPDVILYIKEMEQILQDANYHGLILALFPLLARYKVPLIGSVNTQFYNLLKQNNSNLLAYFDIVNVNEPSLDETLMMLLTNMQEAEEKYGILIQIPALRILVKNVKAYFPGQRLPRSAFNIFERSCVLAATMPKRILDLDVVNQVLQSQVGSKIYVSNKDFAVNLMHLQEQVHKEYVNQEQAVKVIADALVRNYTQLSDKKRPIGVFLFLGTTGVGKTFLAKTISKILFGENYQIIRVDLSQYKMITDVKPIIDILAKIRLNPSALVLLDEFEKANPQIYDIFLRLFDEGVLQDPETKEDLYFNNSLIVATSNVGSDIIMQNLQHLTDEKTVNQVFTQIKQLVMQKLFNTFKPELLNRFDSIVVFKPLSKKNLKKITRIQLNILKKELLDQGIKLLYDQKLVNYIVETSYNPALGARVIRRFIDQKIKSIIAKIILEYKAEHGINPQVVDLRGISI